MHPTRDQIAARLAPGADAPAIDAAVPMGPDGIDATASGLLVSLTYATTDGAGRTDDERAIDEPRQLLAAFARWALAAR